MVLIEQLSISAILGLDFLEEHKCIIDIATHSITIDEQVSLPLSVGPRPQEGTEIHQAVSIACVGTIHIPPHSEIMLEGKAQQPVSGTWLVEALSTKSNVIAARSIVQVNNPESIPIRVLNPSLETVTLYKGSRIAKMESAEECIAVAPVQPGESAHQEDVTEALRELVSQCQHTLSPGQQQQLHTLLEDFSDIFALTPSDLGKTTKVKHRICTEASPPIRQPVRRVPVGQREQVREELRAMSQRGVIQPSTSPWASPLVLVKKKDGSIHFCVGYRKLNTITRKDAYPIPRIDETLDTLSGSCVFTTLDLLSGYWQVEMHPEDKEKTAVCTPEGLFEFNVMPFGLCNAPATFQRLMDCVLAGLHWETCLVYLDDVIVLGKSFEDHLRNLQGVFQRLREAGLKLKTSKCNLCQEKVSFLGHIVSQKGISTDPSKIEAITKWPTPTECREVQQFLGLCNYYRRFIRNFATIAKPLHRLTEKTREFRWTADCEEAFQSLKTKLSTAPILAFPHPGVPFIVDADASNVGIGAVLSQKIDGTERVIAYGSRALTKSERQYCVTRRELLAIVTFLKKFRPYLLGRHFQVRSDHGSLTWLRNFKEPEGQLARWLEQLQEFDFDIIHRPGCLHKNADALSRIPCKQCGRHEINHTNDPEPVRIITGAVMGNQHLEGVSNKELQAAQEEDALIGDILRAVREERGSADLKLHGRSPQFKRLVQLRKQLLVKNGLLFRTFESEDGEDHTLQLVVPQKYRKEILQQLHDGPLGGHMGAEKTHSRLKQCF
jgi:hypothetical protein